MILAVALFMEQLDSTVIATSLPAIAADIGSSPIALKLALTSYFVALAIFIPISGWMSDRFGARNIFRIAILIFVFGSIACAFSNSLPAFVVSRFFQGMGASMMTPVGRLLLVRSTPRSELVSAMAWLSIPALVGPICGPPLGGFLTTYLSWHWIFWINVPVGIAGILLAGKYLPVTDARNPRPIDVVGFILAAIAFSGTVFGLSVISLPALPIVYGYLTTAVGIVAFLFYLLHARRARFPLLDPKMFRYPLFRAAAAGGNLFRIGIGATPFLMPLMLQLGFGYSAAASGGITFVSAAGAMLMKATAPRVVRHFGFRPLLIGNALLSAVFLLGCAAFAADTAKMVMLGWLLCYGFFRSLQFTCINTLGYADVPPAQMSQATSFSSTAQQLTLSVGVGIGSQLLNTVRTLRDGALLEAGDFRYAFIAIAVVTAASALWFRRLSANAGSSVSGHARGAAAAD
jgi:EmrB/QacA subfamily drug resistance transporter